MACPQPLQEARPIDTLALSLAYPGGRADIFVRKLDVAPRDLSPARTALARTIVARRTGCAEDAVMIGSAEGGAPIIVTPKCRLHISLAGRDDLVTAAVADGPVGVDIETVGAPFEAPRNILHPAERAALDAAGADAHESFLRIWTAKEAYVKATGTGFSREPSDSEIRCMRRAATIEPTFSNASDFEIFDCGRPVPTVLARVGHVIVGDRLAMLAYIVLAPAAA